MFHLHIYYYNVGPHMLEEVISSLGKTPAIGKWGQSLFLSFCKGLNLVVFYIFSWYMQNQRKLSVLASLLPEKYKSLLMEVKYWLNFQMKIFYRCCLSL